MPRFKRILSSACYLALPLIAAPAFAQTVPPAAPTPAPRPAPENDTSAEPQGDIPTSSGFKLNLTGDAFYSGSYFGSETLAPATYQAAFLRFNAGIRAATDDGKCEAGLIGRNLSNNYYLLTAQDKTNQAGDMRGTVARGRQIMLQAGFKFLTRKH